jgi:transposase
VHTNEGEHQVGRQRRRRHSAEFKAEVIAACQQPGVSIAAVALAHGLNANLLRHWIIKQERAAATPEQVAAPSNTASTDVKHDFVPVTVAPERNRDDNIRVELRRGATTVTVVWPMSAAADCAAWLRELLR